MDQNGLEIVFLDHLFFVKEVRELGDPRHLFKEIFFAKKKQVIALGDTLLPFMENYHNMHPSTCVNLVNFCRNIPLQESVKVQVDIALYGFEYVPLKHRPGVMKNLDEVQIERI